MKTWIALIRGINVGGRKKLAMEDVRGLLREMGFPDVKTLLQSGNLLFTGGAQAAVDLEKSLETQTSKRLGIDVGFLVRTRPQWETIIALNPFPGEAKRDPSHLAMMCLKESPSRTRLADLTTAITGRELVHAVGAQLYVVYPDGIGRSKLTHALIEKTLGTRGTARNWNTVLKIAEVAEQINLK